MASPTIDCTNQQAQLQSHKPSRCLFNTTIDGRTSGIVLLSKPREAPDKAVPKPCAIPTSKAKVNAKSTSNSKPNVRSTMPLDLREMKAYGQTQINSRKLVGPLLTERTKRYSDVPLHISEPELQFPSGSHLPRSPQSPQSFPLLGQIVRGDEEESVDKVMTRLTNSCIGTLRKSTQESSQEVHKEDEAIDNLLRELEAVESQLNSPPRPTHGDCTTSPSGTSGRQRHGSKENVFRSVLYSQAFKSDRDRAAYLLQEVEVKAAVRPRRAPTKRSRSWSVRPSSYAKRTTHSSKRSRSPTKPTIPPLLTVARLEMPPSCWKKWNGSRGKMANFATTC
jgi:hypothetical protein